MVETANKTAGRATTRTAEKPTTGKASAPLADKTVIEIGQLVKAGAAISYGEKVTVAGKEMLPVALAFYAFGGGAGGVEGSGHGAGHGGGGQSISVPLGAYIVDANGDLHFEPNIIALCTVAIPLALAGGAATAKIIKAFRR
jgi:hypothetical protein